MKSSKPLQSGYINGVNLARFSGAIGIIAYHYACHNGIIRPYLLCTANDNWGDIIVTLFIALSGACLVRSYSSEFTLKKYFTKRWLAIYPMFYLCYLFFAIEASVRTGTWWTGIPWYRFGYTLLGIDGYLVRLQSNFYLIGEWFLGALIVCYLIFPLLRWLLQHLPYLTAGILLVGTWFIPYLPVFSIHPTWNLWTCTTIFYLGMLMAQSPALLCSKTACLISTVTALLLVFLKIPHYDCSRALGPVVCGLVLLLSFVNIGAFLERSTPVKAILAQLGKLSYPMFLVQHILILRVLEHWSGYSVPSALFGLLIATILSMLLAWTMNLILQKIMASIKQK